MAYDEQLAERVRVALPDGDWVERSMFGGLAFLLEGTMRLAVGSAGGLMVRLDRAEVDDLLEPPEVDLVSMGGRRMKRWLGVSADRVAQDADLDAWIVRALRSPD